MLANTPELLYALDQYHADWSAHVQRLEAVVNLLHMLKQGMELFLLTCAYLAFYLIDCLVQVASLL